MGSGHIGSMLTKNITFATLLSGGKDGSRVTNIPHLMDIRPGDPHPRTWGNTPPVYLSVSGRLVFN